MALDIHRRCAVRIELDRSRSRKSKESGLGVCFEPPPEAQAECRDKASRESWEVSRARFGGSSFLPERPKPASPAPYLGEAAARGVSLRLSGPLLTSDERAPRRRGGHGAGLWAQARSELWGNVARPPAASRYGRSTDVAHGIRGTWRRRSRSARTGTVGSSVIDAACCEAPPPTPPGVGGGVLALAPEWEDEGAEPHTVERGSRRMVTARAHCSAAGTGEDPPGPTPRPSSLPGERWGEYLRPMRLLASILLVGLLAVIAPPAPVAGDEVTWTRDTGHRHQAGSQRDRPRTCRGVGAGARQQAGGAEPGGPPVPRRRRHAADVAGHSTRGHRGHRRRAGSAGAMRGRHQRRGRADRVGGGDKNGASLTVVRSFTLPAGLNQNEGFALTQRNGTTIAVWGNRGSVTAPGRLFAATFDPDTGVFGPFVKAAVAGPVPQRLRAPHQRHPGAGRRADPDLPRPPTPGTTAPTPPRSTRWAA